MEGKASIVIPCYNKEQYIGCMLESVIAQKWGNIQLVLVNDGSTDGTRAIISEYMPKFEARGFETVIIDQDNAGCCAAVKAGISRASGDYLCVVDADDELDPYYVSTMAGWLEEHGEYDYCSCGYTLVLDKKEPSEKREIITRVWPAESYTPEFFLCNDACKAAWAFLSRMSYIRECGFPDIFYTDTRGSYEPSFFIPFTVYGGRMKRFDAPLYYYSGNSGGLSQDNEFDKKNAYWREYHRVTLLMLDRIPKDILDTYKRKYLAGLSSFYILKLLLIQSLYTRGGRKMTETLRREFLAYVNNWVMPEPQISYEDICEYPEYVCRAAEMALSGVGVKIQGRPGRIIGYGALGKNAVWYLSSLKGTPWYPTELWDRAGDGARAKKPDLASLNKNDAVIVLPSKSEAVTDILSELDGTAATVLSRSDVDDLMAWELFPVFKGLRVNS